MKNSILLLEALNSKFDLSKFYSIHIDPRGISFQGRNYTARKETQKIFEFETLFPSLPTFSDENSFFYQSEFKYCDRKIRIVLTEKRQEK